MSLSANTLRKHHWTMELPEVFADNFNFIYQCSLIGFLLFAYGATYHCAHNGWKLKVVWPGLLFLAGAGLVWQVVVAFWVPEPYLDEVFHIPQAQKYCLQRWSEWDDKITTPPGLYLSSFIIQKLAWLIPGACYPLTLRLSNWVAILFVALAGLQCRRLVEANLADQASGNKASRLPSALSIYALHTGINIALFPLLFFFSGLYYTDVFSTLAVLGAFWLHLERVSLHGKGWKSDVLVIALGLLALLMRQTNVFWVVVFLGGLEAVHTIKSLRPPVTKPGQFERGMLVRFYISRYSQGDVHDPSLKDSGLEDVIYCALSIAIGVVCNPIQVLKQVWAHIVVGILFGIFILWNGGVVLGDKLNHIATIHLPQLLYIWPLFAFFSAPLVVPWVIHTTYDLLFGTQVQVPQQRARSRPSIKPSLLSLAGYAALAPIALAIVQFNTIIHPFTLADNRHYMFYVFRYSILRAPWVRFALVPVYVGCGILCLNTLAGYGPDAQLDDEPQTSPEQRVNSKKGIIPANQAIPTPAARHDDLCAVISTSHLSPSLSTVLLWALATTLSLVSAPLVEPRYFILPWVFWRLLVPAWRAPGQLGQRYDLRLWVESVWFVLVNVVTMYIFITRPFYWYGPDGEVADGGRVQRFMW